MRARRVSCKDWPGKAEAKTRARAAERRMELMIAWRGWGLRLGGVCAGGEDGSPQRRSDAEISAEKKQEEKSQKLREGGVSGVRSGGREIHFRLADGVVRGSLRRPGLTGDRKSTRLNSSHLGISYAV